MAFIKKVQRILKSLKKNQFYDQILLKHVGYLSSKDLGQKFSLLQKIQAFKVKIAKKMDTLLSKIKNS